VSSPLDFLPNRLRANSSVLFSATAVGLSAIVVAYGVGAIGQALLAPSINAEDADPLASLGEESAEFMEKSRLRFEGRSMYSLPPRPVPKVRVVETPKLPEPPKVDLGPPPPPATYTGPAPTGVLGEFVFFSTLSDDDKRIKVGETKAGITVLAANPPYSVRLGYQRGEYTVPLWAKADDRLLTGGGVPSRVNGVLIVGDASGASGGSSPAGASVGSPTGGSGAAGLPGGRGGLSPGRSSGSSSGSAAPSGRPPSATAGAGSNPNTLPPGDQPGGDVPSGPGPEGEPQELPSAAMEPQRLNPPANGNDEPPAEYVDRELLPPRLSDEQIAAMSEAEARAALAAIDATDSWTVDDHSRARLDHERHLLRVRLAPRAG
jgi:hypothetical protein